jgi:phosphatidate cytidylyltransferase
MHTKRWITGLVALPFLIFFIHQGGIWLFVLVAAAAELGLWEYYRIILGEDEKITSSLPLIGFCAAFLILYAAHRNAPDLMVTALAFNLLAGALIVVLRFGTAPDILKTLTKQILGVTYIPLLLAFLLLIRHSTDGIVWLYFTLAIVFAGDVSALYVGSALGRHKLSPAVSPGKTVEGSLGGLVANLGIGCLIKLFFLPALPWPQTLLFCLLIGAAGQVGDLFESVMKRSSQVKDSGGLLPGHGGILDRIDALLFAAPIAYLFKIHIFKIF